MADEDDRVGEQAIGATDTGRLPDELAGRIDAETHFGDGDPEVVFARESGPVTIVIYDDGHDLVYDPGLAWMTEPAAAS